MERIFLDANVLFSAAYREDSGLRRIWELSEIALVTSTYAVEEARRNLGTGEPRLRLDALLVSVQQVAEVAETELPPTVELPDKDRPILLAAIRSGAAHLLTGDVRHFGRYFGETVGGVRILPPSDFLRSPGNSPP